MAGCFGVCFMAVIVFAAALVWLTEGQPEPKNPDVDKVVPQ